MPDGLHLSDTDFYRATISAKQYLTLLEAYLERMLAFGATDEDTARRWFLHALTTLGYKDYATYEARVEQDTRILNPQLTAEERAAGVIKPYMLMLGLQLPDTRALPYYKQVVAPIVYRQEAERQAVQFGYVDEEGNIVDEGRYNALLRSAIQDAEKYKYDFIQENLNYQKEVAEFTGDPVKIAKANENIRKVNEFIIAELGKQQVAAHEEFKKLEREEAWAGQLEAGRVAREAELAVAMPPTAEPIIREFLEEERPAGLQEFIKGRLPSVLERFEREQAGARTAWQAALQQPGYEEELAEAEWEASRWATVRAKGLGAGLKGKLTALELEKGSPLAAQDVMPGEWAFYKAPEKMLAASRKAQELRALTPEQWAEAYPSPTAEEMEDPLKRYLAQYPWSAEFLKMTPKQKAPFRPSMYAPSARWFV